MEKLNPVACKLDLPIELEHVHNAFHISQLRRYILDPNHALVTEPIELIEDLTYKEHPIQMLDHNIKQLCKSKYL